MNTDWKKLYSIAIVALLTLSVMPIVFAPQRPSSTPPAAGKALWIEPVDIDGASVGTYFNVTVWGKCDVEYKGWSFRLIYENATLAATGAWYCLADGSGSMAGPSEFMADVTTAPVAPAFAEHDATHHRVDFGEAWMMGNNASAKTGKAALVEFQKIAIPDKGGNLTTWIDISTDCVGPAGKTYILGGDGATKYFGIAYDAFYQYAWSEPAGPTLAVRPEVRDYDQYTLWNGTTFPETVKLESLSGLWYLTNVTFTLSYDISELKVIDITKNTVDWDVALTVDNTTTPGVIDVVAKTSAMPLSGDIDIITVTFEIIDQEVYPDPDDVVPLPLTNVEMWDHTLEIIPEAIVDGEVTIRAYQAMANPWMEVSPVDTVVGNNTFVKHTTFDIDVTINRLHFAWKLVGVEFRLWYNYSLVKVVNVQEGPYLGNWAPYGTWFKSFPAEQPPAKHVLVGNMILPNGTGDWNPPFPGDVEGGAMENGTIATITFEIIEQLPEPDILTDTFDLFQVRFVDYTSTTFPSADSVNGTYTCLGFPWEGRKIDLYGGANNAGYGACPFPQPYGGQGLNQPMDLVIPQSEVCLCANLTYNYWPVQSKEVNFEVEGPYFHLYDNETQEWYYEPKESWFILLKETATSDEDGVACISFAMPWPCMDPELLLGVYKVTATTNIRDEIINDTMYYYYDYMVHIWKVSTDKYYYHHCETVEITIDYGSHAMQTYPALFSTAIKDELNVVIGMDLASVTVGGAEFCTYANGSITLYIHVEKWAFVGYADIYVNCYDKDPTEGGFAWTPQAFEDDIIYILPN